MNAKQSVNAGFNHDGNYRYLDPSGKPMQIEVPKDQYQEAVRIMEEKIKAGKVPGVTDPKEAKKLVREGQVTYRQAINISKFGTVESLVYDAAHGTVVAANAMGISSAVVFAKAIIDGDDLEKAIETAIASGLKAGGAAFATSVIAGQLSRTQYVTFLKAPIYVYTPISCDQLSLNAIIYLINLIYKYIQGRYSYEQCNVNVLWSCYVCFEQW